MVNFTLKQLRYFEALAQHGHFGRAADACAISQPALSMQIKELEESVGSALFDRSARSVRLTGFGEEFAARAQDVLRAADALGELARASRDGFVGRLRLGVIPTVAPYLLPRIIADVTRSFPGLDLQVRETMTPRLLEELNDGRLDTAIVALPVSEPAFSEVALFDERFVLVRHVEDADAPVPDGAALREMRLLLLEEGHCFRDQALAFCSVQSALSRDGLDGSSLSTLVQMVGAGIGVTLIPEMAVPVETRSAPVAIDRFEAPEPRRTVGMIWRRASPLEPQLRALSDVVRGAGQALYQRGANKRKTRTEARVS